MLSRSVARRDFVKSFALSLTSLASLPLIQTGCRGTAKSLPNFIIIFCDDLGYGDLGCFGSIVHRTPNIDRMAAEGRRFTSFYVTSGVCTPSRASLLTGCYPRRVSMQKDAGGRKVLFPVARKGLNPGEITIAEILRDRGYATACIGKWHLGDQPEFLPTRQGFDYYYGIPYSNDMRMRPDLDRPPLPLLRNETVIEAPVDQDTITRQYTDEAIQFITEHKEGPFFLYLPHTMPHNPVHASKDFQGISANGGYGDAVEEIDWSTGKIMTLLQRLGIEEKTLIIFTSDNGAATRGGGSNAPLSGWKDSTMEGGMRVPCIMRWPGRIPAGTVCAEMAITMDLLPTLVRLAGAERSSDRIIDGKDIWPLMTSRICAGSPHKVFYYYRKDQLQAVRSGRWKLHLPLEAKQINWRGGGTEKTEMKLYDLNSDIAEIRDISAAHPEVVSRLLSLAEQAREDVGDTGRDGHQRPAGMVVSPKPLLLIKTGNMERVEN